MKIKSAQKWKIEQRHTTKNPGFTRIAHKKHVKARTSNQKKIRFLWLFLFLR
jgi:hypothetical protein